MLRKGIKALNMLNTTQDVDNDTYKRKGTTRESATIIGKQKEHTQHREVSVQTVQKAVRVNSQLEKVSSPGNLEHNRETNIDKLADQLIEAVATDLIENTYEKVFGQEKNLGNSYNIMLRHDRLDTEQRDQDKNLGNNTITTHMRGKEQTIKKMSTTDNNNNAREHVNCNLMPFSRHNNIGNMYEPLQDTLSSEEHTRLQSATANKRGES